MIEEKILSYENNKQAFKSRKIAFLNCLRIEELSLMKGKKIYKILWYLAATSDLYIRAITYT